MDKAEATKVQREVADAIDTVLKAHGLKMVGNRASYGVGELRLTISLQSTDPALDPKVTDWNRYAEAYGLPKDALGKEIVLSGRSYRINGLETSRRKYPVAVTALGSGKPMLLTVAGVKRGLGLTVQPWER